MNWDEVEQKLLYASSGEVSIWEGVFEPPPEPDSSLGGLTGKEGDFSIGTPPDSPTSSHQTGSGDVDGVHNVGGSAWPSFKISDIRAAAASAAGQASSGLNSGFNAIYEASQAPASTPGDGSVGDRDEPERSAQNDAMRKAKHGAMVAAESARKAMGWFGAQLNPAAGSGAAAETPSSLPTYLQPEPAVKKAAEQDI